MYRKAKICKIKNVETKSLDKKNRKNKIVNKKLKRKLQFKKYNHSLTYDFVVKKHNMTYKIIIC